MKSASFIRKKFSFNNIQILSKYELQSKYESVQAFIQPDDILQDLSFFIDLKKYFDTSNIEKSFLTYKFTLYCYLLVKETQEKFFKNLFLKYTKTFLNANHKYYSFIIIKIHINEIFDKESSRITVQEFNKMINYIVDEYKMNTYDCILETNINNFIKDEFNKSLFLLFIDGFKYPFNKEQINAISKYIVDNSEIIIKKILVSNESKKSFFKKANNIIQSNIKEIPNILNHNNSKRKSQSFIENFFISIIAIYNTIIIFFKDGYYSFYEKKFLIDYIQINLIMTLMQFLEKKYFFLTEKMITKVTQLFDNIDEFLVQNLKLDENNYFFNYTWILSQFFKFLYHYENKKQSIIYGNKIINSYKDKSSISTAIIFIKLSLYENYLKNQKDNLNEYDLEEHVNNISELITMIGKCELNDKNSEKKFKMMINYLFQLLTDHIIYIINNRLGKAKDIYKLLIKINPFMIHCANNSKNKNLVKGETYFQLYYYLTNIISTSSKENNNHEKNNIIKFFIKDKNFNDKEKNSFVNIMSFFIIYGKNSKDKIEKILTDLYDSDEKDYFLDVYFNFLYQLEKRENFDTELFFNLLKILINFIENKYEKKHIEINEKIFNNYFNIYIYYVFNCVKYAYTSILKPEKTGKNEEKNNNTDNKYGEDGIMIKIIKCISLLNEFVEMHIKILNLFFPKEIELLIPYNKPIYNIHHVLYLNFIFDLLSTFSNENSLIFQQIYLIAVNENIFNNMHNDLKNIVYYFLYRLLHNLNSTIDNRDLYLIKGESEISKNIKSIIYSNILLLNEERKKNKKSPNDSFFNLEPLINTIIESNEDNESIKFNEIMKTNIIFKTNLEENVSKYINFKTNFISDTNKLIEIIKLHYISGQEINSLYLQSYFKYYLQIFKNEKEFNSNFSLILSVLYLIKSIFIPEPNSKLKINFHLIIDILKNKNSNIITKKNIIIRLLIKYIYNIQTINDNKKKINDLLIILMKELEELKNDKTITNNENKTQKYLTYIELLSLEYFIQIYNGTLSENNIDELMNKGIDLLIKCLELLKAFLSDKYIRQFYPNDFHRLKAIYDFLFNEINQDDSLYLLNLDDYDFIFSQLLNKIYKLSEYLFDKMFSYGYGDTIVELFHKFRLLTIVKCNKNYCVKFFSLFIKIMRKWKRKEKYDISIDIGDFKSNEEYENFISKLYLGYARSKYVNCYFDFKNKFDIVEFVNNNKIENDLLLNKCLELENLKNNFSHKEKSNFMKNIIHNLKTKNIFIDNNINKLKHLFIQKYNITSLSSFYFANFLNIENKYIIKIIPLLFEEEIINNLLLNEQTLKTVIDLFKSAYQSYNINNWREYKYIKYCKKNLKHLIYISSSSEKISEEINIKLINLYISYFHNFKYNLSYKGNENYITSIIEKEEHIENVESIEKGDNIDIELDEENKMDIDIREKKENGDKGIQEDKYKNINLIIIFRINNYLYLYIKLKEKISYDKINIDKEKDFESFFSYIKEIAANENSEQKIKKKKKNEEYRKALFTFQNLLIKYCPNFIKSIKKYYESHTKFTEYINTKIEKYSLKISINDVIKWIFETTDIEIKNRKRGHYNTSKRIKLMSIDDYKKKFLKKIFFSNKFKFSFYEGSIKDLFYYIPSIELSKLPLENIPLLYNLAIVRTLNINYIKFYPLNKKISMTKEIFCLLNPKSDLIDTEKKILPILKKYNIKCINSKEPSEKEMENIISNKLMYIYCGHGSSLKYLKKEYIESHNINFLTFLFGCSSASSRLLSEKDTQPLSTPQLFLKKLCPFFFGFLWPVSSSDLDELTVELLNIMLKNKGPNSLIKVITLLKRKFSLKWFNGGALVMYCNSDILPEFEK